MRRPFFIILIAAVALGAACATKSDARTYTMQGQVLSIDPAHKTVTVKLQGFDSKDPGKVRSLGEFTAFAEPRTLTETGASFVQLTKERGHNERTDTASRH